MAVEVATSLSPVVKSFLAGSLSGTCSTLIFQPLDLVKTRIQSPQALVEGSTNIRQVVLTVIRTDRIIGLWRGITPSIVRTVPGVGLYFSSLHQLRTTFCPEPTALQSGLLGMSARSLAATALLPMTVVKTRFESGRFAYRSIPDALRTIGRGEGAKGLFSGLSATLLRDAPFSGLYLMFYSQLKRHSNAVMPGEQHLQGATLHFMCGLMAGTLASAVTQPADVIKTSMQMDPGRFRSIRSTVVFVFTTNGMAGFFRGFVPRATRRTLMAALAWTLYEEVMQRFNLK